MDFGNLLIFRIGHLGDTVVALPALWAIRTAFPKARLTFLTNNDLRNPHYVSPLDVLPDAGLFDDWITYPTNLGLVGKATAFLRLSLELRKRKFDAVIYLMPRIRSAAQVDRDTKFFRLSGVSKMLGTEYLRRSRLASEIPKPTPAVESESEFLLSLLSSEGFPIDDKKPKTDMRLSEKEIATARTWFHSMGTTEQKGRKLVAVAPGSKWASKVWDETRYADVVRRLITENNCYPIIFGGGEDREKGERLVREWTMGANGAGALSIRESAALLQDCTLYLGNDTGAMHLAAAVGTPCVAVFAAIDWKGRWTPFGKRHHIFRETVECEGCHTPNCFNHHKCLELVGKDEVYEACRQIITETDHK